MPRSHTSRDFEAELRELRAHSLAMGARCERSLQLALEAFWTGSKETAAEVMSLDRQIDDDEMKIDALVLRILALRQPVAYDLRFLTTALKLVTDLERIGDEAVNIAERSNEGHGNAKDKVGRAEQVLAQDDAVDEAYGEVLEAMTEFMREEPGEIPAAIRIIKVAKYIERIADHATNIAEEVIFMVRGDDVRHVRTHPPPKAV